jgi:hypothetical protein
LALEEALSDRQTNLDTDFVAYQFNRIFLAKRPSNIGLVKEYLFQSIRPTVAFPYIVLIALLIITNV